MNTYTFTFPYVKRLTRSIQESLLLLNWLLETLERSMLEMERFGVCYVIHEEAPDKAYSNQT
jgi:hypothetical protein